MNYLHYDFNAGPQNTVVVTLNGWANVQLLDDTNYQHYLNRRAYQYHGGRVDISPYRITPPRYGHWHLVVNRGGYAGTVNVSVQIL